MYSGVIAGVYRASAGVLRRQTQAVLKAVIVWLETSGSFSPFVEAAEYMLIRISLTLENVVLTESQKTTIPSEL